MPPERGRALLPVLRLIATAGHAGSFLYLPALPEITREFGAGAAGVQATPTAIRLGFGVRLTDRFGHRIMLAAAAPDMASLTAARAMAAPTLVGRRLPPAPAAVRP